MFARSPGCFDLIIDDKTVKFFVLNSRINMIENLLKDHVMVELESKIYSKNTGKEVHAAQHEAHAHDHNVDSVDS